ncbi:MAG: ROK family protein, partial [Verrucomicrobia bacterium]|nr:ROK family protein [Cytophagales bacterium]
DESGGECYCGKIGCVERVLSGPSLQRFYASQSGKTLVMKDILANYQAGNDPIAQLTIERMLDMFGRAVSVLINIIDPDVIVLGGGLANIDLLYTEGVEKIKKHIFNTRLDTVFLKPQLGDSAGVFGAALL